MLNPITAFKTAAAANKGALIMGGLILVALAVFAISRFIDGSLDRVEDNAEAKGRGDVISEINTEELGNVKKTKAAVDRVRSNDDERIAQCVRDSDTPENCH